MAGIDLTGKDPFAPFMGDVNKYAGDNTILPTSDIGGSLFNKDLLSAGASFLGSMMAPSPAVSSANSVFSTNQAFDNSGMNVSFGSSSSISSANNKTASQGGATGASGNLNTYYPYIILLIGGLIAMRMTKKR